MIMCNCKVCDNCPMFPESHTTKVWMELPDKVSVKNKWYVVSDYRTDDHMDIPRFKFGDGVTMVSQLPWVTAAITDNDIDMWDNQALNEEKENGFLTFFSRLFNRFKTK